jgi:pimeloyl-ACP methyl ester carboxylesterase
MSTDLAGLCASLRLDGPIVVVGQSYGGLVAGLHAAQLPSRVGGIVQLDPTPELDDPFIDAQLKMFRYVGLLSLLLARLRLANPMFASLWEHFPRRQAIALETLSYRSPASLRGALVELRLIAEIRWRIAQHRAERVQPRLVISAGSTHPAKSRLLRRLIDDDKLRTTLQRMQALHRDQVAAGSGGIGELAGPHTHGGLVSTPDGAAYSATRIRAFLETVGAPT